MGRRKKAILLAALCAVTVAAALAAVFTLRPKGSLEVSVVDAYTLVYVSSSVVLPEYGRTLEAARGRALFTGLALRSGRALSRLPPKDWGETTVLIYADGYLPEAVYGAHIYEDGLRRMTVYMFPLSEEGVDVVSVVESPDKEWTKRLTELYAP